MNSDTAISTAFDAVTFIIGNDDLRDRFLALSGLSPDDIRTRLQEQDFLASVLEFLIGFEPDLMAFAEAAHKKPEHIVQAWRALGGGAGQEW